MLCPCSRFSRDVGSDGLCRGLGDHGLSSQLLGAGHRCPSWVSRWPDPGLVPYGPPQFLGGPTGQFACNQQHRFIWADCSGDLPADPRRLQPLLQLLLCGCWALRCPHILTAPSSDPGTTLGWRHRGYKTQGAQFPHSSGPRHDVPCVGPRAWD